MTATQYSILVFRVFSAVPDLVSLICVGFSKTCASNLGKTQDVPSRVSLMDELLYFSAAFRERTFHVAVVVPSFGSLMGVFAPVAHLSFPPWSLTVGCAVIVDPERDRSGMLLLCCVFSKEDTGKPACRHGVFCCCCCFIINCADGLFTDW